MKFLPVSLKTTGKRLLGTMMLVVLFLCVGVSGHAQQQALIPIKFTNATVQQVLSYLEEKTDYDFVYNNAEIAKLPRVSIDINGTLQEILRFCLKNSNLSYQIRGKMIVIKPKSEISKQTEEAIKLGGTVTDETGQPLAGVAVVGVGTGRGAVTGANGEFILPLRKTPDLTLSFTFLGKKPQTIVVFKEGKMVLPHLQQIKVRMEPSVSEIDQVVVTGIVNLDRKSFTGAATTISAEEIKQVSPTNALSAIQMFDPSFRLAENLEMGSNPNAIPEMYIRGRSGIGTTELDADALSERSIQNNPNLPIFMLDGYEVSATKIYDLDIDRIESYTVLKDAAATAMYGSRAANGVVVITTKPLQSGELNVSYNGYLTINVPDLTSYHMMNASEKVETERLAGLYDWEEGDDASTLANKLKEYNGKLQNIERGINTDWLALPLRTSVGHKHSVSLSGGAQDFRYGLDLTYDNQAGVMKGLKRERMGLGFTLQYQYKSLTFRNYISADLVNSQESPYGSFSDYVRMNPYDTYLDENGNIAMNMATWQSSSQTYRNPMYDAMLGSFDKTKYHEFYDNFDIRWNASKKLYFKANLALSYKIEEGNRFLDPESTSFIGTTTKGSLNTTDRKNSSYDLSVNGYYNDRIGKHNLNIVAGFNVQEEKGNYTGLYFTDFPKGGFSAPGYAKTLETRTFTEDKTRLFGAVALLNYTYNDIILFDLSGRIDGSSQFGSNKRFAPFFSTGLGFNIHNLKGVQDRLPWLTQFKVRTTYGMTGKVNFPSYAAQNKYELITEHQYGTGSAVQIKYLGNPNLKWEKTIQNDFGVEMNIFKDLFYFKYTYYIKNTDDLIADLYIPASSGFTSYKENVGQVENRGHEIEIRSRVVNTKNTKLYLTLNGASNKNKLKKISNSLRSYNERVDEYYESGAGNLEDFTKPLLRYYEGCSMTSIYAMQSLGIDPVTGDELFMRRDGSTTYTWSSSENIALGDTEPTMSGTFGFNLYWKNFSLSSYFMYEWGGQRYNNSLVSTIEMADIQNSNCDIRVLTDRWIKPGDIARFRDIKDFRTITDPTSRFIQDYNVLTLSSLSLGYEFDRSIIERWGMYRLKLQLNGNNLFTASSVRIERGLTTPFARTFTLSVSASF